MLAIFIGGGAVAWHIMACVESPMSFAPNGDLAFTVMEPYDVDDIGKSGEFVYRVLILGKERKLREVEASRTHLLSGPGYSPDGEHIAYLRLPLLTKEDAKRIEEFVETRRKAFDEAATAPNEEKWIFAAPENSVPRQPLADTANLRNLTLPASQPLGDAAITSQLGGAVVPVQLVVRNLATGEQIHSVSFDVPMVEKEPVAVWDYLLAHPSFSPDGSRVFVWIQNHVFAVNPATGGTDVLAAASFGASLSPDGRTIATFSAGETLAILRPDGSRATYVKVQAEPSLSGLTWLGDDNLAVLVAAEKQKDVEKNASNISIYDTGGNLLRTIKTPITRESDLSSGELAISPDGRHMAISFGEKAHFLTADGDVLSSWEPADEDELLVQPTFTPDSGQIAFKLLGKETADDGTTWKGTKAIVFFSPEGRELFRVPVPHAEPAEPKETVAPQQTQQTDQ